MIPILSTTTTSPAGTWRILLLLALLSFRVLARAEEPAPTASDLREVGSSELASLLEKALRQEWKVQDGDLVVTFEKAPPEVRIPPGELSLRWVTRLAQPNRRVFPQFELVVDGRLAGKHACPIHVEWFREVWVAETALTAQTPVGHDVLKRQRLDTLALNETPWMGDPSVDECSTTSPVSAGSVVLDRQVRKRPLIHRGETVAARLQDGSLSVEFQAVALEDGYRGGGMKVRSLLKPVEMRGKVLNETTVVVVR